MDGEHTRRGGMNTYLGVDWFDVTASSRACVACSPSMYEWDFAGNPVLKWRHRELSNALTAVTVADRTRDYLFSRSKFLLEISLDMDLDVELSYGDEIVPKVSLQRSVARLDRRYP